MTALIILLVISQIVSFILLFKKVNPIIIKQKVKGIYLEPIPKPIGYTDLDEKHLLVKDVIDTIEFENWNSEITHHSGYSYEIVFTSHDDKTQVKTVLHMNNEKPYDFSFRICLKPHGVFITSLVIDGSSPLKNEIITLLWKLVIDFHKKQNDELTESYQKSITDIKSRLKAVNRDKTIDQIIL